ncbi:MAG: hypothetical protein H9901_00225 [Candidatus Paralactobacillus gallistercoris]|uniref:TrbC/VIRB2 family protein n=1 Tax=Candidatus Paralactobacillus gallistercoris TaxID=2838724 RepID=A0A948TIA9_9LACO|nr:hypothetical protein [Candidatus Paralactobacillus gallistercoris]
MLSKLLMATGINDTASSTLSNVFGAASQGDLSSFIINKVSPFIPALQTVLGLTALIITIVLAIKLAVSGAANNPNARSHTIIGFIVVLVAVVIGASAQPLLASVIAS